MSTHQLWPSIDPSTLTRQVWDTQTARRIPGVGRALDLICGLMSQMPLDQYAGIMPMDRPRLLEQPDLDLDLATFTAVQVEDWLLQGNAAHLVTARFRGGPFMGWPAAVKWYPAHAWNVAQDAESGKKRMWLYGREVSLDQVVHVQNGADPMMPCRGQGVVERYLNDLDRIALQSERERVDTKDGQVPSVAVIVPQKDPQSGDLDEAAKRWADKFDGPGRKPVFLPNGTQVETLGWSPNDAQATAARQLALTDTANMFNLDGTWLGAPNGSHNYKSPGPLFLTLVRTTLGRIMTPFQQTWSEFWLPRGRTVRFDREAIEADDLASLITTLTKATGNRPVMTINESRARLRLAPVEGGDELPTDAKPAPAPEPDDTDPDDPDNPENNQQEDPK